MDFSALLAGMNQFFTVYFVVPALMLLGLYLTWQLRFVQITKLKMSFLSLFSKDNQAEEGNISHYQAISSVLAGNLGTGNISGMAVALSMGGPGALLWMWVMAFLAASIQFVSCFLGVKYRTKNERGAFVGGPMYYISKGLGWKGVSTLFAVLVIFGSIAAGGFVQVNSVALPLAKMGIEPWISGVGLAILVAIVVLGGASRVSNVSSAVVPIMAFFYLGAAIVILATHASALLPSIQLIFKAAFGSSAIFGGALGYTVMKALTTGFNRAIFATDAGTGIVPILQSEAKTKNPVIDGVVTLIAPFLVLVVCSSTILVLMVTGVWTDSSLQSTNMVMHAFDVGLGLGGKIGSYIVLVSLFLFGYTTTLAYATCIERAVGFLFGTRLVRPFQILYILMVPVGALLQVNVVWLLADITLTSMLVINLFGVAGLSREAITETRAFFKPKSLETL